jgi:hypothetical protein
LIFSSPLTILSDLQKQGSHYSVGEEKLRRRSKSWSGSVTAAASRAEGRDCMNHERRGVSISRRTSSREDQDIDAGDEDLVPDAALPPDECKHEQLNYGALI